MTPEMDAKFREQHGIVNYSLDRFAGVPYTWDSSLEEIISFLDSRDLIECPLSNYSTEYIREWAQYRGDISLDDMTRLEAEGRTPF